MSDEEDETSAASDIVARTHASRGGNPDRWNRKTRWFAGVDRLPSIPADHPQFEHIRSVWIYAKARTIKEGWEYYKKEEKHEVRLYVEAAKVFASVYTHQHEERCSLCTAVDWEWLWSYVDEADPDKTVTTSPTDAGGSE